MRFTYFVLALALLTLSASAQDKKDAARQSPTSVMINGQAVKVETQIVVNFQLSGGIACGSASTSGVGTVQLKSFCKLLTQLDQSTRP